MTLLCLLLLYSFGLPPFPVSASFNALSMSHLRCWSSSGLLILCAYILTFRTLCFLFVVLHPVPLVLSFFGRGSCKHSCLCLYIYIQCHPSGFMAWQSPLQPGWMTVLLPVLSLWVLLWARMQPDHVRCSQWALSLLLLFKMDINANLMPSKMEQAQYFEFSYSFCSCSDF